MKALKVALKITLLASAMTVIASPAIAQTTPNQIPQR